MRMLLPTFHGPHLGLWHSRKLLIIIVAVMVLVGVGGVTLWQHAHAPETEKLAEEASEYLEGRRYEAIVWIKVEGYLASTLRIHRDTVVFWENRDTATHRIVFTPGGSRPELFDEAHDILPGKQFGARFMKDGTYQYHDPLYPDLNGTIVVSGK